MLNITKEIIVVHWYNTGTKRLAPTLVCYLIISFAEFRYQEGILWLGNEGTRRAPDKAYVYCYAYCYVFFCKLDAGSI